MDIVQHTTDETFKKDVLEADRLVIVDFWAEWCGPCKAMVPTLEIVGDEFKDKLSIFKINIEENVQSPSQYSIRSIPTLLFFKEGELIKQLVGAVSKSKLVEQIEEALR